LPKAEADVKGLAVDLDDTLIYALYPVTGKKFLKWKYGKEEPPKEVKARTLEQVKAEDELVKKAKAGLLIEKKTLEAPEKSENLRTFNVFVGDEFFEVGVDALGESPVISYLQQMPAQMPAMPVMPPAAPPVAPAAAPPAAAPAAEAPAKDAATPPAAAPAAVDGTPLPAPMPGMIVSYAKQVGDPVEEGETVVVLEAMKMENALPAPKSGKIQAINFSSGDTVAKGDVLLVIG
jgi:oxaloacetate decarboxylase alpha subunit/pyruvate carboxylase subunit B